MKGVVVVAVLLAVSAAVAASGCSEELSTTLLADFKDCAGFWQCADGAPLFQTCPEGLHFSARLQRCTLPFFARCQAVTGEAPVHSGFMSSILATLRNVVSKKAEPVPLAQEPPEFPTDDLPNEEDTIRRFPDVEAGVADDDTEEAKNEDQKSADEGVKNELDTKEEEEQDKQERDGKEEEQDESEKSEEKIEEEENEVDGGKEEDEEKTDETSDVEDVAAENDDDDRQDSKKDATVVKRKDEEEEEENKKKSKDIKRKEKESKKNKLEEKGKDSESDAESDED